MEIDLEISTEGKIRFWIYDRNSLWPTTQKSRILELDLNFISLGLDLPLT